MCVGVWACVRVCVCACMCACVHGMKRMYRCRFWEHIESGKGRGWGIRRQDSARVCIFACHCRGRQRGLVEVMEPPCSNHGTRN